MLNECKELYHRYMFTKKYKSVKTRLAGKLDLALLQDIISLFQRKEMKPISILVTRDFYITPLFKSAHEYLLHITGCFEKVVNEKRFLVANTNNESIRLDRWFRKPDYITAVIYEDLNTSEWIIEFATKLIELKELREKGFVPVEYFDRHMKIIEENFILIVEIVMEVTP